mmetsp:Transcript_3085/g.5059  ORF Transcript_3085/g.5059 Transcript_3085/m.5059 type:complete len:349 (-) Transcript_3085:92-1138(-)
MALCNNILLACNNTKIIRKMTMSSASDSLLVLFIMGWGLIMALCLFMALMRAFFACVSRIFNGEDVRRISVDLSFGEERGEIYQTMPSARQEEIDNLRKNALIRYMSRFTLKLGDEHLLCCTGSQTDTALSLSENEEVDDERVTTNETCQDIEGNGDIEKGSNETIVEDIGIGDMAQDSNSTATAAAEKYTHISLPLPGCDIEGKYICSCSMEAEKEDRQEGNKWKLPSLFQTRDDDASEKSPIEPVTNQQQQQKVEKRNVPIFCAICLSEYEKCDRVCWSSNTECSHVFHEDCILQWLISSGKKRSMNQSFTRHPTDEKLLENEFCPCCRQDFICVRPALIGGEESV